MRAWIEIDTREYSPEELPVALFMRAWIEIDYDCNVLKYHQVALFMRAWIEIRLNLEEITFKKSPSS